MITWDPPSLFERNGVITEYQINVTRVKDNERKIYMVSVSDSVSLSMQIQGTKLTVTSIICLNNYCTPFLDLDAYTEYYVAMSARTQVGFGPYSSSFLVQTFESSKLFCKISNMLINLND